MLSACLTYTHTLSHLLPRIIYSIYDVRRVYIILYTYLGFSLCISLFPLPSVNPGNAKAVTLYNIYDGMERIGVGREREIKKEKTVLDRHRFNCYYYTTCGPLQEMISISSL